MEAVEWLRGFAAKYPNDAYALYPHKRDAILDHIAALEKRAVDAEASVKRQASAIRTLHACEETEINRLRKSQREWHTAVTSLDSEREANARLTEEVERLTAERDAAKAEIAQVVVWQPIETAPKDGTEVLVAAWVAVHPDDVPDFGESHWAMWIAWQSDNCPGLGTDGLYGLPPTHWMPLPEPPQ